MNILDYLPEEFKQVSPDLIEMINNAFESYGDILKNDHGINKINGDWSEQDASIAETLIYNSDSVSFTMSNEYVTISISANKHKVVIYINEYSSASWAGVIYTPPEIATE